ncbi:GTPase-activating protein Gyp6p [[Candida] jaroonii]|uniref:GTPase-activating protein Gyp6p n=1 Tax=[Candida] jaroonii TaxID=467808 RepID=A0ACA9Y1J8_9ASCO|nr:GTPase-activating protein Gyp6p [[Candida] jaroonii]
MSEESELISKTLLTIDKFKTVDNFKQAIQSNEYQGKSYFIRSLIWKTLFLTESLTIDSWSGKLNDCRRIFHELVRREDMQLPWDTLDHENIYYKSKNVNLSRSNSHIKRTKSLKPTMKLEFTRVSSDPLSTENTKPGHETDGDHESTMAKGISDDTELLSMIIVDVDRIFPGDPFFTKDIKRELIEILYVWSKCNQVGYKQGFHEILGLIFKNLYNDCVSISDNCPLEELKILKLFNIKFFKHDVFQIFNKFLNNFGIVENYYRDEKVLLNQINVFNMYLLKIDQLIHYNLISKLNLESQLWCIKYFRLVLIREFEHDNITNLWDKLVTVSPLKFPMFLNFLIITMMINLKSNLIIGDFTECLSLLLHYPTDSDTKFMTHLFDFSVKLLDNKDDDLKLYQLGMKINSTLNPNLKISLSLNSGTKELDAKDKMALEKYRMEMRLKKRVQSLMR